MLACGNLLSGANNPRVSASVGIVGMCKEHLGVALALKVPVFFVITKVDTTACTARGPLRLFESGCDSRKVVMLVQVDICPEHVLKHTLDSLQLILRKPGVKKRPFMVRSQADVLTCARRAQDSDALAPIFLTSSVTGMPSQHTTLQALSKPCAVQLL